jgi:DNA-binding transcriptional LysR family regulator
MTKLTSTDLRGFSYFLAVADEKSLSAAAKRLHMAQPPLSVQIRKLEDRVGVALFERGSHGMRLTDAGRALYAKARDAIRLAQDGFDAALAIGSGQRGVLKVGIMHALCYQFLPLIADALQNEMPHVDIRFEEFGTPNVRVGLDERRINVALGVSPIDQDGLRTVVCGRLRYRAAVSESAFPGQEGSLTLRRLTTEPLILLPTCRQDSDTAGVLQLFKDRGYCPHVAHRVQTVHGALALIKAGMGVAVLPESVEAMLPSGVELRPIDDVDYGVNIAASWLEDMTDQSLVERFVKVVQPILAQPSVALH